MELIEEFTYTAALKPPVDFGAGPLGARLFFEVIDGRVAGERINGEVLGGGGDWARVGRDGLARIDVRIQLKTDDGAAIFAQYDGLLQLNEAVQQAMGGGRPGTEFGDQYFRTTPRFETGDERYAWLTQNVFVSEGRITPPFGVEYRVFRVA
jgi:hypothetical protein